MLPIPDAMRPMFDSWIASHRSAIVDLVDGGSTPSAAREILRLFARSAAEDLLGPVDAESHLDYQFQAIDLACEREGLA